MKYRDVMDFEPIETVIRLSDASSGIDKAAVLVESYVTSEKMTNDINKTIISNLNLNSMGNKGVFVVGNYGSGKSHLMSVISSVAEHRELLKLLKDENLREDMEGIAGRFEVLRIELGATLIPLRSAVIGEIEKDLQRRGINYKFPDVSKIPNNKQSTLEMMGLFKSKYPDKGYLIVVDELLDFIRGKKENEIIQDLNYLREIGELCGISDIRFITGIQEPLFDNPSFHFLAGSVRRVADRFDQFIITNEDMANVVSKRLLKKTEEQKRKIREHIWRYCKLYSGMAENLEGYIDLYPMHPSFFDVIEQVLTSSNRDILKAVSVIMRNRMDEDIENGPGIISYDEYCEYMMKTPSVAADQEIKRVLEARSALHKIIADSDIDDIKKSVMYRIINALSVFRLTGGDTYSERGITLEGLIDELNLFTPLHDLDRDTLRQSVSQLISDMIKVAKRQFIAYNSERGEYYLDLRRDVDFDRKIDEAIDVVSNDAVNRYFYEILLNKLELSESGKVTDAHLLWSYSLIWEDKNIERSIYIKLGIPEDEDCVGDMMCVVFLGPYENAKIEQPKDNFFYFVLNNFDEGFENDLKHYSAARYLYQIATADTKKIYDERARKYAKNLNEWLDANVTRSFAAQYRDKNVLLGDYAKQKEFKEVIDKCINIALHDYLEKVLPEYPRFNTRITNKNRSEVYKAAINYLSGKKNELGKKLLESLGLYDSTEINTNNSPYARYFLQLLEVHQDVIKSEDIMDDLDLDKHFRLEREWVIVILLSLVYCGEIVIKLKNDHEINIINISEINRFSVSEIISFVGYAKAERPLLGEIQGIYSAVGGDGECSFDETSVKSYIEGINSMKLDINACLSTLSEDLRVFGIVSLRSDEASSLKEELKQLSKILDHYKEYNTLLKMQIMKVFDDDVKHIGEMRNTITSIKNLKLLKDATSTYEEYLTEVEKYWCDDVWKNELRKFKEELAIKLKDWRSIDEVFIDSLLSRLDDLKTRYINAYVDMHNRCRADKNLETLRESILNSSYKKQIDLLRSVNISLPLANYNELINNVASVKICQVIDEDEIKISPICPYCKLKPTSSQYVDSDVLKDALSELKRVYENCASVITDTLEDPVVRGRLKYLSDDGKDIIKEIIESGKLPEDLDPKVIGIINELLDSSEFIEVGIEDLFKDIRLKRKAFTADELKSYLARCVDSMAGNKKVKFVIK